MQHIIPKYPALKSVYGKDQSVILAGGKLSSSPPIFNRKVFNKGSSRDSKMSDLNCFYKSMKHHVCHHYQF